MQIISHFVTLVARKFCCATVVTVQYMVFVQYGMYLTQVASGP
jgi:hypothetical protein